MGDAINIAARMEQTAAPGTVQISDDTYRLVAPLFEVEALGGIELKGKSEPVAGLPRARPQGRAGPPARHRRGERAADRPRSRDCDPQKAIDRASARAAAASSRIIGEAGLGKSRLLTRAATHDWNASRPRGSWDSCRGIPYDSSRPLRHLPELGPRHVRHRARRHRRRRSTESARRLRASTGASEDAVALCSVAFGSLIAAKVLPRELKDSRPRPSARTSTTT